MSCYGLQESGKVMTVFEDPCVDVSCRNKTISWLAIKFENTESWGLANVFEYGLSREERGGRENS